jgi:hypothetical protein
MPGDSDSKSRQSSRERIPNVRLDQAAVDGERLVSLERSRSGYAGKITQQFRAFTEAIQVKDVEQATKLLGEIRTTVIDHNFVHDECIYLARQLNPSKVLELESSRRNLDAQIHRADELLHAVVGADHHKLDSMRPEDSVSQLGQCSSISSTSSARAKAAARTAAIQAKMLSMKRIQELEYEQLQFDIKQKQEMQRVQMEGDLQAALEEERVLAEFEDGTRRSKIGGSTWSPVKHHTPVGITAGDNTDPGNVPRHLTDVLDIQQQSVAGGRVAATGALAGASHLFVAQENVVAGSAGTYNAPVELSQPFDVNVGSTVYGGVPSFVTQSQLSVGNTGGNVPGGMHSFVTQQPVTADVGNNVASGMPMRVLSGQHQQPVCELTAISTAGGSHLNYTGSCLHPEIHVAGPARSDSGVVALQQQLVDAMSLPKTIIMKFDGDPLKYWQFKRSFESCVGRTAVDDAVKLNRLFDSCTGKAAKVIAPCAFMNPSDGYQKAQHLLEDRFGNQFQISEAWIKTTTEGPQLKPNDAGVLQDFVDDLRSCVETLKAMNMLEEMDSRLRMVKIVGRLPGYLQGRWRKVAVEVLQATGRYPTIDKLVQFLEKVAREYNDPVFGYNGVTEKTSHTKGDRVNRAPQRSRGSNFSLQVSDQAKGDDKYRKNTEMKRCYLCSGNHSLSNCKKFMGMSAEEKLQAVKDNRLCFNCLGGRHLSRWCKAASCECGRKHSKILHDSMIAQQQPLKTDGDRQTVKHEGLRQAPNQDGSRQTLKQEAKSYASTSVKMKGNKVALPVVSVSVRGNGNVVKTQALLDPGSNRTFCSRELLKRLKMNGIQLKFDLETLSDSKDVSAMEVSIEVSGRSTKRYVVLHRVLAVERFPTLHDGVAMAVDLVDWDHLSDLELPNDSDVQLLIGQDNPNLLKPLEVRCSGEREPYAVRTALGWTINGPLGDSEAQSDNTSCVSAFIQADIDMRLDVQVERFWKVDSWETAPEKIQMSLEDIEVLQKWDQVACLKDGHYELPIPFKFNPPELPDNRKLAERRLGALGRRLCKHPRLFEQYKSAVDDLLQKGFAEQVSDEHGTPDVVWYLPHHAVVSRNKPDKIRIVYDCAAELEGVSLNKQVLQGPDLVNSLLGVLLRFRENKVALMSDVEAMFHQVRVTPGDRDVLRFLWWKNGDITAQPLVYRMTSHLFGGIWSPSCAAYALRRTAQDHKDLFPCSVVNAVLENFYVDDCLVSIVDEQSACQLVTQLCELLAKGGFRLTKWLSNSRTVLATIPETERAKLVRTIDLDHGASMPIERALGVQWDTEADQLGIRINTWDVVHTRRGLLSVISSVYDPLGIVGPYILVAKKILQSECKLGKGWDESLSEENRHRWTRWLNELPLLTEFNIDRCLVPTGDVAPIHFQVHHFCDASEEAYGSVCYLRSVCGDGTIHCAFLMAKSRLAPLKVVTIPRLELMAAVLAVKLDGILRREMHIHVDQTIFWTDSTIVLQYIRNRSKRLKTFVANRVAAIHDGSSVSQWRHIDTNLNPADDASRGLNAKEMLSRDRWSNGRISSGMKKQVGQLLQMRWLRLNLGMSRLRSRKCHVR